MNRLSFLFLPLTAIGVSACSSGKLKEEVKRPNIIFMMTDDHTTQAISCYGGCRPLPPGHPRMALERISQCTEPQLYLHIGLSKGFILNSCYVKRCSIKAQKTI